MWYSPSRLGKHPVRRVENTGPPGSGADSECAAYARATCRRIGARTPAERSRLRCILAYALITPSSATVASSSQPGRGALSRASAADSDGHA